MGSTSNKLRIANTSLSIGNPSEESDTRVRCEVLVRPGGRVLEPGWS